MLVQIIGWIALSTASLMLLPQVIKIIVYKKISGLSLFMFVLASLNYLLWIIYGILLDSLQIFIANILAFVSSFIILCYIIFSKLKNKNKNSGTESQNQKTRNLNKKNTIELLKIINSEDKIIAELVSNKIHNIKIVIDNIYSNFENEGRLFYVGAGTSGRVGILDASEIYPTYGIKNKIIGIIAGGKNAIQEPVENAEDDMNDCVEQLKEYGFNSKDSLIVIGASGKTPCCIGSLKYANTIGAFCSYISMNNNSEFSKYTSHGIEILTGPEVVTGSTRMKAGTATKIVLNMISTTLMIKLGYVVDNYMINMKVSNDKLKNRAINIVSIILNIPKEKAEIILSENNFDLYRSLGK